jgi:hypothetical protein
VDGFARFEPWFSPAGIGSAAVGMETSARIIVGVWGYAFFQFSVLVNYA